jgi:hypothetical protein
MSRFDKNVCSHARNRSNCACNAGIDVEQYRAELQIYRIPVPGKRVTDLTARKTRRIGGILEAQHS